MKNQSGHYNVTFNRRYAADLQKLLKTKKKTFKILRDCGSVLMPLRGLLITYKTSVFQ